MAIITLTTDFGREAEYAGLLKAAILSVDPNATVVDVTHGIDPQDIRQAAFSVEASWRFFPSGTIHLAVVDPGVGSARAMIGLAVAGHFFIAPDNGVLSLVLARQAPEEMVRLENESYRRERISPTFHGRDIMAPAAAHLGLGRPLSSLGPALSRNDVRVHNDWKAGCSAGGQIAGTIVAVDRFGNLITNIGEELLPTAGRVAAGEVAAPRIAVDGRAVGTYAAAYSDVDKQVPLALIGSRGYLEIAVNCGNAGEYFKARKGGRVKVELDPVAAEGSTRRMKDEKISP